jgi:hemoglobin
MTDKKDIEGIDDIRKVVDAFYEKVRVDELLAPVFNERIEDWPTHLETMYRFWNAALFGVRDYKGNPFMKHATLPVEREHFIRWLTLFNATLDVLFEGPKVDEAKQRSLIMAQTFHSRIHASDTQGRPAL